MVAVNFYVTAVAFGPCELSCLPDVSLTLYNVYILTIIIIIIIVVYVCMHMSIYRGRMSVLLPPVTSCVLYDVSVRAL